MLKAARIIAAKDLRLMAGRGGAFTQALLLGLLLIVLFSLSLDGNETASPSASAAIFWLASVFCLTIVLSGLFNLEEANKQRLGLLLAPAPAQAVWLGKTMAGLLLLLVIQAMFLAASVIFLGQSWQGGASLAPLALLTALLVDVGVVSLAALLGPLARGHAAKESLSSLVVFPLLVPQLLAGIRALSALYAPANAVSFDEVARWLGMAAAYDAIFIAVALVLFPVIYGGDD